MTETSKVLRDELGLTLKVAKMTAERSEPMGLGTHTEAKANAIVTALEAVGASAAASDVRSDSPPDAENRADSGTDALVPQLERLVTLRDSGSSDGRGVHHREAASPRLDRVTPPHHAGSPASGVRYLPPRYTALATEAAIQAGALAAGSSAPQPTARASPRRLEACCCDSGRR